MKEKYEYGMLFGKGGWAEWIYGEHWGKCHISMEFMEIRNIPHSKLYNLLNRTNLTST